MWIVVYVLASVSQSAQVLSPCLPRTRPSFVSWHAKASRLAEQYLILVTTCSAIPVAHLSKKKFIFA